MTQFWMFKGLEPSFDPRLGVRCVSVEGDPFLVRMAARLFPSEARPWTIVDARQGTADALFVEAQCEVCDKPLGETRVGQVLLTCGRASVEIVCWYGDDLDNLDVVTTEKELMSVLSHALGSPECETYLRYVPVRPASDRDSTASN